MFWNEKSNKTRLIILHTNTTTENRFYSIGYRRLTTADHASIAFHSISNLSMISCVTDDIDRRGNT